MIKVVFSFILYRIGNNYFICFTYSLGTTVAKMKIKTEKLYTKLRLFLNPKTYYIHFQTIKCVVFFLQKSNFRNKCRFKVPMK